MSLSTILIYGRDEFLNETRRLVLKQAGFHAEATTSFEVAQGLLAAHPIEVLILCYQLSAEACESIEEIARSLRPKIKVLYFESSRARPRGHRSIIPVFDPRTLIRAVRSVTSAAG